MRRHLATFALFGVLGSACNQAGAGEDAGTDQTAESTKTAPPKAKATWIEAATVEKSSATLQLVVPGEVEGSREAVLASSQGGFVEVANIEVGDEVDEGDVLFKIDASLYRARAKQVEAELSAARREHKRAEKLGRVISQADRDAAKDRFENARAGAKVAALQAQRATIRAPFPGVVASVDIEQGEVAGLGVPVARLLQLDPIKVTVSVPDRDVVGLRVGSQVAVTTDALPEPRIGKLVLINPAADIDTRAFFVEIEVPNEDRALLPGMIARVRIDQSIAEDTLILPQSLLVTQREANGVFVVQDEVARWRPLKLGAMVRDQVVIEQGLAVGDNVVVVGQRALADGDPVIVSRQGRCCAGGRPEFGS